MPQEREWPWTLPCGHEVADLDQIHYCSYIGLPALTKLVRACLPDGTAREFMHHDEHQFVIVHQVCELGFMEMLFELRRIIPAIGQGDFLLAEHLLEKRLIGWLQLVKQAHYVTTTMRPADFLEFRKVLPPASGAESPNFPQVELLSGLSPDSPYLVLGGKVVSFKQALNHRPNKPDFHTSWWLREFDELAAQPNVVSEFKRVLAERNMELQDVFDVASQPESELGQLKKAIHAFWRYEWAFFRLRKVHIEVAKAQIGEAGGSGGSLGISYLRLVAETARFWPELWSFKFHG